MFNADNHSLMKMEFGTYSFMHAISAAFRRLIFIFVMGKTLQIIEEKKISVFK